MEEEEWGLQTSQTLSHSGWIFTASVMGAEAEKGTAFGKRENCWPEVAAPGKL